VSFGAAPQQLSLVRFSAFCLYFNNQHFSKIRVSLTIRTIDSSMYSCL
jgi:hypothetical protein